MEILSLETKAESFPSSLAESRAEFVAALTAHVESLEVAESANCRVIEAVQYATLSGGKHLRPLLVIESCRAAGGTFSDALPAAIAIECVHVFSLVHDDLPAMDDDDLRRGRATTHVAFGEADAILAGDWLLGHAFAVLSTTHGQDFAGTRTTEDGSSDAEAAVRLAWVRCLSRSVKDMIVGQSADIRAEGESADARQLAFIHEHKTASLIAAACELGAIAARADDEIVNGLRQFGREIGHAFQIVDDLLDVEGSTAALGKRTGKDADRAKQTFPAVHGVETGRTAAREKMENAVAALTPLGENKQRLVDIAEFMIRRAR